MTEKIVIEDMNCNHCKAKIESAVGTVVGISSMDIDLEAKTLSLTTESESAIQEAKSAIQSAGYSPS